MSVAATIRSSSRPHTPPSALLVLALLPLICLGGCTKLVYDRLDTLAGWYLQSLVTLDDTQRSDLHAWLESTLEWHRESELTRYAQFLRELSAQAAQPGSIAIYQRNERQIQDFVERVADRAVPDAARLLMGLSSSQVEELGANLAEKSRERSDDRLKELANGTWRDQRAKDIQRQIKRWTGTVTDEQKTLARQAAGQFEPTTKEWLESQQRWRTALLDALAQPSGARESPQLRQERILRLLREPESLWTETYRAANARNRERTLALLESIDTSLTAQQRSRLQRELLQMAEQLESMTL
jgi:hypothetical protein